MAYLVPQQLLLALSAALACGMGRQALAQETLLSLADGLTMASQVNPDIVAEKHKVNEAGGKRRQQEGEILPQVDASGTFTRYGEAPAGKKSIIGNSLDDYYAEITLKQVLYSGGKYTNQIRSADVSISAEEQRLEQVTRTVHLAVKKAFFELLRSRITLGIQKENLGQLQKQHRVAQLKYSVGRTSNLDVLKIETQVAQIEDTIKHLQQTIVVRTAQLGQAIGFDHAVSVAETSIAEVPKTLPPLDEQWLNRVIKNHPEWKVAYRSIEKASIEEETLRTRYHPTVYAKMNFNAEDQTLALSHGNWYAGLVFTMPIFQGGSDFAASYQSASRRMQAEEGIKSVEQRLWLRGQSAILGLRDSVARVLSTRKTQSLAQQMAAVADLKYQTGNLSSFDLVEAQATLNKANSAYQDNLVDFSISWAELEYLDPNLGQKGDIK